MLAFRVVAQNVVENKEVDRTLVLQLACAFKLDLNQRDARLILHYPKEQVLQNAANWTNGYGDLTPSLFFMVPQRSAPKKK